MSRQEDPQNDGSFRSETARADIEATRQRMGETLEELGARLNPNRLKQQAKDKVRDATIGRGQTMAQTTIEKATSAGRTVTDVVRENPIPAAMIAAAISWLFWNSRRGQPPGTEFESRRSQPEYSRAVGRNHWDPPYAEPSSDRTTEKGATRKARQKASG